jgi:hypothetical protein
MKQIGVGVPGVWSCCGDSDVVHIKFRVNRKDGTDEWMYLASDGTWKLVPPDIILWDKVNDPMNDGHARLWQLPMSIILMSQIDLSIAMNAHRPA